MPSPEQTVERMTEAQKRCLLAAEQMINGGWRLPAYVKGVRVQSGTFRAMQRLGVVFFGHPPMLRKHGQAVRSLLEKQQ